MVGHANLICYLRWSRLIDIGTMLEEFQMGEGNLENIREYLQRKDVQERIQRNIQLGREEASVKIGSAAKLFGFTENQLRDWERTRLLKPSRSTKSESAEQEVRSHGQRQYTPDELDKLAIIKELIEEGGYLPSAIPSDIDKLWTSISNERQKQSERTGEEAEHLHIDQRIERANKEVFWRYYASQVLRLSLMLICEDIPDTIAGLVLPLQVKSDIRSLLYPSDLQKLGESLVGWLSQDRAIHVFLDRAPSFEYPSDFRVHPLQAMEEGILKEDVPQDNTLIIVQRKARPSISMPIVQTIRRLLKPLYEDVPDWQFYFGLGMRDSFYPASINSTMPSDDILNGLADMVVRLGGQTSEGEQRWRFCCILLPEDPTLPLQQRGLVVRGQSKDSPHKVNVTAVSPGKYINSLSLRAFQSGHLIYRPEISSADTTIVLREVEGPIRSTIAISIGGEKGQPVAVLYVASDEVNAFSKDDQRVLRMMGRVVEELLRTYSAREQVTDKLGDLIRYPRIVDTLFGDFLSENEFVRDVGELLTGIKTRMDEREEYLRKYDASIAEHDVLLRREQSTEEVVSFIGIDVDNQSSLANKYGDRTTRNLSRTIGLRVQEMVQALVTKHTDCKLYHMYADRFYLLLNGIQLEHARAKAEAIRQALEGRITIEQPVPPAVPLVLTDVTIRLGVSSYTYTKLEENLVSDNPENIIAEVRAKIARALDVALNMGKDEGGNVVMAWDRETRGFVRWPAKV